MSSGVHFAARQLISQKQTLADTMRRPATGHERTHAVLQRKLLDQLVGAGR